MAELLSQIADWQNGMDDPTLASWQGVKHRLKRRVVFLLAYRLSHAVPP
jgi:hypothetical protein